MHTPDVLRSRGAGPAIAAALVVAATNGRPLRADTIHVPEDFPTIQAAIDAASDGDEIIVAPGTYAKFDFVGKCLDVRSSDGPEATVVTGAGSSIVTIADLDCIVLLEGFTVRDGAMSGDGAGLRVVNTGSRVTVRDCAFVSNLVFLGSGGAVYLEDVSQIEFLDCRFAENEALVDGRGGAIFGNEVDFMDFRRCTFEGNTSEADGSVNLAMLRAAFSACTFTANAPDGVTLRHRDGYHGELYLDRCTFDDHDRHGVRTFIDHGFIHDSTFRRNDGCGISIWGSEGFYISGSLFCENGDDICGAWFDAGENLFPEHCCPPDLDDSGAIGFDDLLALLAAWGPVPECPPTIRADLDGDCRVGFEDLLILLAQWGPCA